MIRELPFCKGFQVQTASCFFWFYPSRLTIHRLTKLGGPVKHVPLLTHPRLSTEWIASWVTIKPVRCSFPKFVKSHLQNLTLTESSMLPSATLLKERTVKLKTSCPCISHPSLEIIWLDSFLVNSSCIHAIFMLVTVWRLFLFSIADFLKLQKYEQHVVLNELI